MPINKRGAIALFLLAACTGSLFYVGMTAIEKLENNYYAVLDEWVQRGGKAEAYRADVLETCEKLVTVVATASELMAFLTTQKEEFDFRVNVCAKTTVHRIHHQPELDDQELVREICEDTGIALFRKLCRRSSLR